MITAHGASGGGWPTPRALGLRVLDATCPLVRVAHRAVTELVRDGFHPVIIGKRDHVEVRGLTEDLAAFDVVLDRRGRPTTRTPAPFRHRRADDAAGRAGATTWPG